MSGALADDDTLSTQLEKCFGGGADEYGIRIHLDTRDVFHEVRFEQHGFSTQAQVKGKRPGETVLTAQATRSFASRS